MESKTDVSVIIPAFNAHDTIGHLVHKLLSEQTLSIEVIVVDDGSTDGTWDILSAITDERLVLFCGNGCTLPGKPMLMSPCSMAGVPTERVSITPPCTADSLAASRSTAGSGYVIEGLLVLRRNKGLAAGLLNRVEYL